MMQAASLISQTATPVTAGARVRRQPWIRRGGACRCRFFPPPGGRFGPSFIPSRATLGLALLVTLLTPAPPAGAQPAPRTHTTPRTFEPPVSRADWENRARQIREQILVSAGLWPMPERAPLRVHRFGRIEHAGYSVEKVLLETWPGFYLGGNLYLPLGQGPGPFPAVLTPHGHWPQGRATDMPEGSIPARCIHFARHGIAAFAYDMVGYGDTCFAGDSSETLRPADFSQRHRAFPDTPETRLWGVNLLGLQLWNSLCALDFLAALPEVDARRIGVTGASGGATQTFLLAAVDDRPAVLGPVCMVSHTMQGGCVCENAPGLRIRFSNLDFAAAAAPRPQILVGATGDWTRTTLEVEGPAVETVYHILGAPERLRYVRFDAGHNYNRASREAVYAWFEHWLLGRPDRPACREEPYTAPPTEELWIGSDPQRPPTALRAEEYVRTRIESRRRQWDRLLPKRREDLAAFTLVGRPLWFHTLQLAPPSGPPRIVFSPLQTLGSERRIRFEIHDGETPDPLEGIYHLPAREVRRNRQKPWLIVLVADPDPTGTDPDTSALLAECLQQGHSVITLSRFTPVPGPSTTPHFHTYNRTVLQSRVRDLATVLRSVGRLVPNGTPVRGRLLWGSGRAGLWALLAAPEAGAVVADLRKIPLHDPRLLVEPDLFCPGYLAMNGPLTPVLLAAPQPLHLARAGELLPEETVRHLYAELGRRRAFRTSDTPPDPRDIFRWLRGL